MNTQPANNIKPPQPDDPFYVGYLPIPRRLTTFLKWIIPAMGVAVLTLALLLSTSQGDPGNGSWDTERVTRIEGVYAHWPYPMILIPDASATAVAEAVLLVETGKHGAQGRALDWAGKWVEGRGSLIARDGIRMLELTEGAEGLVAVTRPAPILKNEVGPETTQTLVGEVIDPKCGLGVMRPGRGRTHKECAIRCISGGIPPMFITESENGLISYYLLADSNNRPVNELVLPFVAEPTEVSGVVGRVGNLNLLRFAPASIHKL